ncbi:MAG: glycosyltransferase family 2 protein, partial [Desulfovibrio sp.]|nr:glycosyltransferase family 2 protein [Desulfovibrio sp.]
MREPLFSVIIPVHDQWTLTKNCLKSLREHTAGDDFEVIVIDNGSADATASVLQPLGDALFKDRFTRIRFEENRNFGPACNAGARASAAPFLFFLNNDTLLTPGWPPPLLESFSRETKLGGAGPLLLYENNTVQHLGVVFGLATAEHVYRGFPAEHPLVKKTRRFQAITAAALMMRKDVFLTYGGFCEDYRNGFEDVDLCLRMKADGFFFTCVPASVVYHLESQTPGRKTEDNHNA